jgi:hypothetical protein
VKRNFTGMLTIPPSTSPENPPDEIPHQNVRAYLISFFVVLLAFMVGPKVFNPRENRV